MSGAMCIHHPGKRPAAVLGRQQRYLFRLAEVLFRMRAVDMIPKMQVVHKHVHSAFVVVMAAFPFLTEFLRTRYTTLLQLQSQNC